MRAIAAGAPVCVSVTHLGGLIYARSAFEASMRHRSATVLGVATEVPASERLHALEVLTEHLLPGRWAELRAPHAKGLAATSVLRVPLDEPVWAGVVPMRVTYEDPVDDPGLGPDRPVPAYVVDRPGPGEVDAPACGRKIRSRTGPLPDSRVVIIRVDDLTVR